MSMVPWQAIMESIHDRAGHYDNTDTTKGPSTVRTNSTATTLDPSTVAFLKALVEGGSYSKSSAVKDSADAVKNAIQTTMQQFMPTIGGSSKGSGMMGDSMSQILATQLATQAAVQGAGVKMNAINDYASTLTGLTQALIQGSPQKLKSTTKDSGYTTTSTNKKGMNNGDSITSGLPGCFITTAVCSGAGLPDDCEELEVLRNFRSTYMMQDEAHVALVRQYYSQAPKLCKVLDTLPVETQAQLYSSLLTLFIRPAVAAIKLGKLVEALDMYKLLFAYTKLLTLSIQSNQSGD